MENLNSNPSPEQKKLSLDWGHLGIIFFAIALLVGISWMENPSLFHFSKQQSVSDQNVPHYYAYVTPPEDMPQPEVLGASTDQGPSIIGDDGSIQPIDMGKVLAAATSDAKIDPSSIIVNSVPDSNNSITAYFIEAEKIEIDPVDSADFQAALVSNDQTQINSQAEKLSATRDALQKLPVPESLVKLQQLKIVQYNAAIALLQNFTQADSNPTLVDQYLEEFIQSQNDLDGENTTVAKEFGKLDPLSPLYVADPNSSTGTTSSLLSSTDDNLGAVSDILNQ